MIMAMIVLGSIMCDTTHADNIDNADMSQQICELKSQIAIMTKQLEKMCDINENRYVIKETKQVVAPESNNQMARPSKKNNGGGAAVFALGLGFLGLLLGASTQPNSNSNLIVIATVMVRGIVMGIVRVIPLISIKKLIIFCLLLTARLPWDPTSAGTPTAASVTRPTRSTLRTWPSASSTTPSRRMLL